MNLLNTAATMSSLELVDLINASRKEGEATLAHYDFLKKTVAVLGEKDAGKISGIYKDSMNRDKPCYRFPKREACLMAMSYSYELQAKVFDRMTELEAGVKPTGIKGAAGLVPELMAAAKAFGFDQNVAAISTNQFVRKITGIDLLEGFGQTHLIAQRQDVRYFTPTELGKADGLSGQKMNKLLEENKLQINLSGAWVPTAEGQKYSRLFDTGKKSGGAPVQQLKWSNEVLKELVRI